MLVTVNTFISWTLIICLWRDVAASESNVCDVVTAEYAPPTVIYSGSIFPTFSDNSEKEKGKEQDAMLSQSWPRDAPYSLYGRSENVWESLDSYAHLIFTTFLMDFCSDRYRDCAYKIWSSYL